MKPIPGMMMPNQFIMPNPQSLQKPEATLYVGNLNPEVSNEIFFELFSSFGLIHSSKIMKSSYTRESRCFGFVTYVNVASCIQAQREMNGKEHWKRELRVHFKKNTKALSQDANFIIKNIAKNVTYKQLNEECSQYGEIISCFIKKEEKNKELVSLGYGYVQFEKVEDGNRFLNDFNGREINGSKVFVSRFVPSNIREKTECKNLYMNNFPSTWTKEHVEEFIQTEFSKFGEMESVGVFVHEESQKFYAFVAFKEASSANEALEKMNGLKIDNENLLVNRAQSKQKRKFLLSKSRLTNDNQTNIYMRSIKGSVTEDDIRKAFQKYGVITSVCLKEWLGTVKAANPALPPSEQTLQYGFINFKLVKDAQEVVMNYKKDEEIKALSTMENDGNFVFFAQPKAVRREYLKMQSRMRESMIVNYQPPPFNNRPHNKRNFRQQNQMMNFPMNQERQPFGNFGIMGLPAVNSMPTQTTTNALLTHINTNKQPESFSNASDYKKIADELRKNKTEFLEKSLEEQKNFLGNIMYARVRSVQENEILIPKITGMLIDTDVLEFEEILEIIEDDRALRERIDEAIDVINDNVGNNENQNETNRHGE